MRSIWYVGHLDEYPDYTTQSETKEEFEEMLRSLYQDITTFDFPFIRQCVKTAGTLDFVRMFAPEKEEGVAAVSNIKELVKAVFG